MVDMVPAHKAMTVCQDSRISGSAVIADSSLCQSVIQSWASLRGSGMAGSAGRRALASRNPPAAPSPAASHDSPSGLVVSKPVSITMSHQSSSRAGP